MRSFRPSFYANITFIHYYYILCVMFYRLNEKGRKFTGPTKYKRNL